MVEKSKEIKRPVSITIICVIGLIGALFIIPIIFSSEANQIGSWYPPYLAVSAIIGGVCMIGLWLMKKWAAHLYTGFVVINSYL